QVRAQPVQRLLPPARSLLRVQVGGVASLTEGDPDGGTGRVEPMRLVQIAGDPGVREGGREETRRGCRLLLVVKAQKSQLERFLRAPRLGLPRQDRR